MKILSQREHGDSRTFKLNHRRCQLYGNSTTCTRRLLFLYWNIKKCTRRRRGVLPSRLRPGQSLARALFQRSFYLLHYSHHVRFTLSVVLLIRNGVFHGICVNVSNLTVDVGGRVWQMSNLTVVTWAWEACVGGPRSSRRRAGPRSRCGRSCSAGPARRAAPGKEYTHR